VRAPSATASDFDSCGGATAWARILALSFCASLVALAFTAVPASAARTYQSQITSAGGSSFSNPFGLAVDGSGSLWVSDTGTARVSKFDSAGVYQTQNAGNGAWGSSPYIEGLAFSEAADKVFVSDSNNDDLWGINTSDASYASVDLRPLGNTSCCYLRVAADNSGGAADGDLYVSSGSSVVRITGAGAAAKFTAGPAAGTNTLTGPFSSAGAVAVSPNGNLFVAGGNKVFVFEPSGAFLEEITKFEGASLGPITALAVDPDSENLVVAEAAALLEFSPGGESLAKTTKANGVAFGNIRGLAASATGILYVADGPNHVIDVFGPAAAPGGPAFPLEVTVSGTGSGQVVSAPSGISCTSGTCTHEFKEGRAITLTATPATHSDFTGWTGCDSEPSPTKCKVTMTAAKAVEARFAAIPQRTLELTVVGSGEVTSSPTGIACTAGSSPCSEGFDSEGPASVVTLTATPASHNHFVGWSGPDSGSCVSLTSPSCQVTMTQARSLMAEFAPNLFGVSVDASGPGSVSATTGAISSCREAGGTCAGQYQESSTITLTASPDVHNHVTWIGCTTVPSANTCQIKLGNAPVGVIAEFSINRRTLSVDVFGLGSVSADAGPISACAAASGTCAGLYDEASTVVLTAIPAVHKHVVWESGECAVEIGPEHEKCEIEIGPGDFVVGLSFPPNSHLLTVTPIGPGSVRADSGAIGHCVATGGGCSGQYIEAGTVTLTARPEADHVVVWHGCTSAPSPDACQVTMGESDADVGVDFQPVPHVLTIALSGAGHGTVTCNGGPCAPTYPAGTKLGLSATADPGSIFGGWNGGGCAGTGSCSVTIDADTTVTAMFNKADQGLGPAQRAKISAVRRRGTKLIVELAVPGAGSFSLSGSTVKTFEGTASGPETVTASVALTGSARKALTKHGALKVTLEADFTAAHATTGSVSKTVTLKSAPAHRKGMKHTGGIK
jgi:DNA-binding beta-propeller fold protein YncE